MLSNGAWQLIVVLINVILKKIYKNDQKQKEIYVTKSKIINT